MINSRHIARLQGFSLIGILLLMPLHGFLTTWLGSSFGGLLIFRAWKELVLAALAAAALVLIYRDEKLRAYLWQNKLLRWMGVFTLWLLLSSLVSSRDLDAFLLGSAIYLRLFLAYLLALVAGFYGVFKKIRLDLILLAPLALVAGFGLLQMFVLPYDFLKHFGYEKGVTIPPYFMIDQQIDRLRIISTSRGPNSLGVYLILPIVMLVDVIRRKLAKPTRETWQLIIYSLLLIASVIVLYGSHSRSGWLGLAAALAIYLLLVLPAKLKKPLIMAGVVICLVFFSLIAVFRDSALVRDAIFHDNPETGGQVNSNEARRDALSGGLDNVAQRPLLGCGAGCAGPASFHHDDSVGVSENSYLQAAEEFGLPGLLAFLMIGYLVCQILIRDKSSEAKILLASFVGISLAGLFMHAWADDIVGLVWWISFGLIQGRKKQGILVKT